MEESQYPGYNVYLCLSVDPVNLILFCFSSYLSLAIEFTSFWKSNQLKSLVTEKSGAELYRVRRPEHIFYAFMLSHLIQISRTPSRCQAGFLAWRTQQESMGSIWFLNFFILTREEKSSRRKGNKERLLFQSVLRIVKNIIG